jgi:acyl-CoA dehydrogenase
VLAELEAAGNSDFNKALDDFDHALFGHIGFATSNIFRSLWMSLSGSRFVGSPYGDSTKRYYQLMTRFSSNLAMLSDIAMLTLGGDLKRRERISARLGDILSYLYLASATLKRFNDEGRNAEELPLVQWAVEDSLYKAQVAIDELISNFPNKAVAIALRAIILPFGSWLTKPSDKLDHAVSRIMQTPCEARNRIGQGQYLTREPENVLGTLEQTLDDVLAAEPVYDKVCSALGKKLPFFRLNEVAEQGLEANAITEEEAELLRRAEIGRKAAIDVDDFDPSDLPAGKLLLDEIAKNQDHAA